MPYFKNERMFGVSSGVSSEDSYKYGLYLLLAVIIAVLVWWFLIRKKADNNNNASSSNDTFYSSSSYIAEPHLYRYSM